MSSSGYGNYRLVAELGHGGMADVFLAITAGPLGSGFSKLMVVKQLRKNLADEPDFVKMLMDEARIAARLNHQNVVQTYEVGQNDNQYFIAMEYLEGQPLDRIQHRIRTENAAVPKPLLYLALVDALAGLHHAHELVDYDGTPLGVVHRDVSPHNIFVTYQGLAKVVDFGIAKAKGRLQETTEGVLKGKIRYMPPEQALGHAVDRRADLFSVGVILWEVATGRRMWADADDLKVLHGLMGGTFPGSPREVEPSVPEAIDRICRKALAPKPDDRYATADEFRTDLEGYLLETGSLVDARRKLGPTISEVFKEQRAEVKQTIEKQLAKLREEPEESAEFEPEILPGNPSGSILIEEATGATETIGVLSTPTVPKSNKRRMAVAAAAAAVLVVGAGALGIGRFRHASSSEGATKEQSAGSEISVSLRASPPEAQIRLDDRVVGNGYHAMLARDRKEHRVEVTANGFAQRVETVTFADDVDLDLSLARLAAAEPSPATAAGASPNDVIGNGARPSTVWAPHGRANAAAPSARAEAPPPPTAAPVPTPVAAPAPEAFPRKKSAIDRSDPWAQ